MSGRKPWDHPNPAVWAGFALRRADGTIEAVEFDASEIIRFEIAEQRRYPQDPPRITVTLDGVGGRAWFGGAEHAGGEPVREVEPARREIEAGGQPVG